MVLEKRIFLYVKFTTEDGVCNPETRLVLLILLNKDMVKKKTEAC